MVSQGVHNVTKMLGEWELSVNEFDAKLQPYKYSTWHCWTCCTVILKACCPFCNSRIFWDLDNNPLSVSSCDGRERDGRDARERGIIHSHGVITLAVAPPHWACFGASQFSLALINPQRRDLGRVCISVLTAWQLVNQLLMGWDARTCSHLTMACKIVANTSALWVMMQHQADSGQWTDQVTISTGLSDSIITVCPHLSWCRLQITNVKERFSSDIFRNEWNKADR